MALATRKPKPARGEAFGILNPFGDFWTYQTFETEAEARAHIADFWKSFPDPGDLSRFKVVRCRVTVSAARQASPNPDEGEFASPSGGPTNPLNERES